MSEWEKYIEWREGYLNPPEAPKERPSQCRCDVEFGTCPGVVNCPYSGEGEEE